MSFTSQSIPGLGTLFTQKGTFNSTDTTDEIGCKGFQKVIVIGLVPTGAVDAQDVLSVTESEDADGVIDVDADNEITISRPAAGSSGLTYQITMIGQGG